MSTITGTIQKITPIEKVTDTFSLRNLVLDITENPDYPTVVAIQFSNQKIEDLNNYKAGDKVEVSYNVKSREYKDKYYTSLSGWRIQSQAERPINQNEPLPESSGLPF